MSSNFTFGRRWFSLLCRRGYPPTAFWSSLRNYMQTVVLPAALRPGPKGEVLHCGRMGLVPTVLRSSPRFDGGLVLP